MHIITETNDKNLHRTVLLNYADHHFRRAQKRNTRTGRGVGRFDTVISRGPQDIDAAFRKQHESILSQEQGGGLWLWKPYWVVRTLAEMVDGEWLFYCDSGAHFIRPIAPMIEFLARHPQDVYPFELHGLVEQHWTKSEVLSLLAPQRRDIWESPQRLGGFHLWRVSYASRAFAREWLDLAVQPNLINNDTNGGNHVLPGFREHRHDQSIFSVLTKLHGYRSFRDPSQYGNKVPGFDGRHPYPQTIELTRQRDLPPLQRLRKSVRRLIRN